MREAMDQRFNIEEGFNYFAQNTSGVSNELDEGKMKQVDQCRLMILQEQ